MYYSARGKDLRLQNILDINTSQKFLEILTSGGDITQFFERVGAKKIAIAPFNHFTKCLIKSINREKIEVDCIYDKAFQKFPNGFREIKVLDYSNLNKENVDLFVVTSNYYQNDIIDSLMEEGVEIGKIVGINTVLYGMEHI